MSLPPSKMPFDLSKERWHPSPLPGHIIIVSTIDAEGRPNIAPKSWFTMASFRGPHVAFGCSLDHRTYQNAAASGEFVVNIPDESLARAIWAMPDSHGEERIRRCGLTLVPAQRVRSSLVAECRAHLECILDAVQQFGREVFLFGRVVAAAIDRDCAVGSFTNQYAMLNPIFFLEDGAYAPLAAARRVDDEA